MVIHAPNLIREKFMPSLVNVKKLLFDLKLSYKIKMICGVTRLRTRRFAIYVEEKGNLIGFIGKKKAFMQAIDEGTFEKLKQYIKEEYK